MVLSSTRALKLHFQELCVLIVEPLSVNCVIRVFMDVFILIYIFKCTRCDGSLKKIPIDAKKKKNSMKNVVSEYTSPKQNMYMYICIGEVMDLELDNNIIRGVWYDFNSTIEKQGREGFTGY